MYAEACRHCGGTLARVFNPAGIVFKGSGFYITDSRKGGSEGGSGGATSTPATTPPAAATPAAPATESKKSDAA